MQAITSENFNQEVIQSSIPVLCDFWAEWCPPCRAMMPHLTDLSNSANGKYKVVKIDIDKCPDLADKYQVSAIPTVIIFKNGEVANRMVGLQTKQNLESALS